MKWHKKKAEVDKKFHIENENNQIQTAIDVIANCIKSDIQSQAKSNVVSYPKHTSLFSEKRGFFGEVVPSESILGLTAKRPHTLAFLTIAV